MCQRVRSHFRFSRVPTHRQAFSSCTNAGASLSSNGGRGGGRRQLPAQRTLHCGASSSRTTRQVLHGGQSRMRGACQEGLWHRLCLTKKDVKRQWAQWNRWKAGFTVVELLVVIAIVAVLLGMLLRSRARPPRDGRIKCVNNLKNVGLAFRIFASDNEDRFPMQLSPIEAERSGLPGPREPLRSFLALSNELSTPILLIVPRTRRADPRPASPPCNSATSAISLALIERPTSALLSCRGSQFDRGRPTA